MMNFRTKSRSPGVPKLPVCHIHLVEHIQIPFPKLLTELKNIWWCGEIDNVYSPKPLRYDSQIPMQPDVGTEVQNKE